jgi:NADH-quinone oxidoreductase subunit A
MAQTIGLDYEIFNLMLFLIMSAFLSGIMLVLSFLTTKKIIQVETVSPYECGFEPFGAGQNSIDIHFYIVGILFLVFDLEILLLFPWVVSLSDLGYWGFNAMVLFLFILIIGFIYEWQKGALI